MNSQFQRVIESTNSLSITLKPSLTLINSANVSSLIPRRHKKRNTFSTKNENLRIRAAASSGSRKVVSAAASTTSTTTLKENEQRIAENEIKEINNQEMNIKAIVSAQVTLSDLKDNFSLSLNLLIDVLTDLKGKSFALELVSNDLDPATGNPKETVKGYARKIWSDIPGIAKYECDFKVPPRFGEIGAVLVENNYCTESFLKDITLDGLPNGTVKFTCGSFIDSMHCDTKKRIFFSNKSYLPSNTPPGLKKLREQELADLRGDGTGERKKIDRIYDYDTYNDLGNPASSEDLRRPVLGGKEHPYPRRCRTGRPHYTHEQDKDSETRGSYWYVPRDEEFADTKVASFGANLIKSALPSLIPQIENTILDQRLGFPHFLAIDALFKEKDGSIGLAEPEAGFFQTLLRGIINTLKSITNDDFFLFDTPQLLQNDTFSWIKDEEFARQMLAGLNPYCIQLVTEWPLRSKLDPEIYGSPDSLITTELVNSEIRGIMTVEEALEQKRLFLLDYHDVYLPYVYKVRNLEGSSMYASRTLLFLNDDSTLRPIAIELTRPKNKDIPQWRQVFTPSYNATDVWLWRLAKSHVCSHDAGYHQLVTHWLRTHCCAETYIIAAHRQLSSVHPVFRLLRPHFRYTMEINSRARESLINAGGIIETTFFPGKYSIEISSVAYDLTWRFDKEALPADLVRRGVAVEDPTSKHGVKLTIPDYPFAQDGLDLWAAIKEFTSDYINFYYTNPSQVENDTELQAWWTEVRTKGHEDKKDEPWWPVLKTQDDLIETLTTIMWVSSGHHAAVNFGQYSYGGYFPNRPTIARINMPTEDPKEHEFMNFLSKPELTMLQTFPSQVQATKVVTVLGLLSSHSEDEEYIGEKPEPSWIEEPYIKAAYEKFYGRLRTLEGTIDERNVNLELKNRTGAGVVPYELLKPLSAPGVTGMGVPNSVSI